MVDILITKIIVLRGESRDLPHPLDSGEIAYSTDEGRVFIGCDPISGKPQFGRDTFPYRNVEILSENSTDLFAKLHGERMKEGGGVDYYDAPLQASRETWTTVMVPRDGEMNEYRIYDIASVTAFVDYALATATGVPIRMGNMHLTHYADYEAEPHLMDNGMIRRESGVSEEEQHDPFTVLGSVYFRFKVDGPLNAPHLVFQYRNLTNDELRLRFKVSRPIGTHYDEPIPEKPAIVPNGYVRKRVSLQVSAAGLSLLPEVEEPMSFVHYDLIDNLNMADAPDYNDSAFARAPEFLSNNERYAANYGGGTVYLVNHDTRTLEYRVFYDDIAPYSYDEETYYGFVIHAVDDEGTLWGNSSGNGELIRLDKNTPNTPVVVGTWSDYGGASEGGRISSCSAFTLPGGAILVLILPSGSGAYSNKLFKTFIKGGSSITERSTTESGANFYPTGYFQDDVGDVWLTGQPRVVGAPQTDHYLWRITNVTGSNPYGTLIHVTDLPPVDTTGGVYVNTAALMGHFLDGDFVGSLIGKSDSNYAISYLVSIPMSGGASQTAAVSGYYYPSYYQTALNKDYMFIYEDPTPGNDPSNARAARRIDLRNLTVVDDFSLDMWQVDDYILPSGYYPSALPDSDSLIAYYLYGRDSFIGQLDEFYYEEETGYPEFVIGILRYYELP